MSSESGNGAASNMSESLTSASDSGREMTNDTEEFPDDDVSEVYSLEIFETVKKGLRVDRRFVLHAAETKQCLQAILSYVEAERVTHVEFRPSREFLAQVFPLLWKHVLRQEPTENLIPEFMAWGRILAKIALTLLEKLTEIEFKPYPDLALRAFSCLELFFESDVLALRNMYQRELDAQEENLNALPSDAPGTWPSSLAMEIVEGSLETVCKMVDRFFSQQIYEEYTDPMTEDLLEAILNLFSQMMSVSLDRTTLSPLCDVAKASITDIHRSPVENLSYSFLSSPQFLDYLYRIIYFTESVEAAEETVGAFRRHVLREQLKQESFKSRLTAVRCLGSYISAAEQFEDPIPLERLQVWLNRECIIGMIVGSHVEKVHYAEHVLDVLEKMVKCEIFETEHIDSLWSLIEPEDVFEGLKDNVLKVMSCLAKKMNLDHVRYVIDRVGKGSGSCGLISKYFTILHSILQREDTSVDYVEPLLKLYWDVLVEMARIDDSGKTINFKDCVHMYFHRGCYDLPEKYLKEAVSILENGQISVTMVQAFAELYHLAEECYPKKQLDVDPNELLVSIMEQYHAFMTKVNDSGSAIIDMLACLRVIRHIFMTMNSLARPLALGLLQRIWDVCVLNPAHPQVREYALHWFLDKMEYSPQFILPGVLSEFLHNRLCQLEVAEVDHPALECFKACFKKVINYDRSSADTHPAMDHLWKIFLNTERDDVVELSREFLIRIYFCLDRVPQFLERLMAFLKDSLIKLAGAEGEDDCTAVIEKLCDQRMKIDGMSGICITRCVTALNFACRQATTDKQQFGHSTTLKNILSQSEMNKVLVFLADSVGPLWMREGVCVVLDSLLIHQPLLSSLNATLSKAEPSEVIQSIDDQLFPNKPAKYTVERTRYNLRALMGALRTVSVTRDDFEDIGCLCLLYILDTIARVDLLEVDADEGPLAQQRLHTIGVDLVGQLTGKLKLRTSMTNSAHSSPRAEQTSPLHLTMIDPSEERHFEEATDAMMISDSSREVDSNAMDISAIKERKDAAPPQRLDAVKEENAVSLKPIKQEKSKRDSQSEGKDDKTDQKNFNEEVNMEIHDGSRAGSPQRSYEHQGSMSVDSVSGPSSAQKQEKQEKSSNVQFPNVIRRVIDYLVDVAVKASRAWQPSAEPALMDVQLVELAVENLIKMIEHWTLALDVLLVCPGIIEIMMRNILNPIPKIRHAFWQLTTTICAKSRSAAETFYTWTRERRAEADQVSAHCADFYVLMENLVQLRCKQPTAEQVEDIRQLSRELVQNIRQSPYEEDVEGMRLAGQLKLLIVLLDVLETGARSGVAEDGLIVFLIQEILFPEAVSLKTSQVHARALQTEEVLEIMKTKNNPGCARHAAFDLLLKLMRSSSMNHRLALECLNDLHFGPHAAVREVAGSNATRSAHGYVGLQNGGATCYINSIIQQLFMQPAVRNSILAANSETGNPEQCRTAFNALQKVFGYLEASGRRCYYPREFLENFTHSDGSRIDVRQHHDALEFFQRTQELVDEHLVRQGMKPIIKNVVGTTHVQQIICKDDGKTYLSASEQTYTSCSLDIVGKTTLHESLEAYVQGERLEGPDAYHCEALGKKVPAVKRLCLKSPPMTLVLQLKRFEMDYQLMETYKNNDRFEFPLELNIFPYTASGLMQKEGLSDYSEEDHSPKLNPAQCCYQLKGIVVHTGEIDGGHYYSFIKERPDAHRNAAECRWWRFDDSFVELWDDGRLDEDCYGGTTGIDLHETQRIPKMNNAYILIYEHVPMTTAAENSASAVASDSKDAASMVMQPVVPAHIEREVLIDNLVLLSACRVADRNYMYFILNLLKTMPSKDEITRRKMRKVTTGNRSAESNCDSSSGSVNSSEKSPDDSCSSRGEGTDDLVTTTKHVASVACEYIFRVILTPCVFLHADGIEWADAIAVIVENTIARDIALQKLVDHADRTFRCLVFQGNEAAKDFLSQFLTKLIQSLANLGPQSSPDSSISPNLSLSLQGHLDPLDMRIVKFLMVVLDYLGHRWNMNFDVSRVLEIACLIAEVLNGHGDKSMWFNLFESLLCRACRFSKIVYMQARGQFMRSLDITNRCIARLINTCLEEPEYDEHDDTRNPLFGIDHTVLHAIERYSNQKQLIKSLLRPTVLVDPGTTRLLTLMSWDNEHASIALLESMQDFFPEMESCDGEQFVMVANAFLDLVCVRDRYYSAKLSYLLFKGASGYTPWALIVVKIQPRLRWRLLYFMMLAYERNEKIKDEMPPGREWERVLDWMRADIASVPTVPSEPWLDKQHIYNWASQFEDL